MLSKNYLKGMYIVDFFKGINKTISLIMMLSIAIAFSSLFIFFIEFIKSNNQQQKLLIIDCVKKILLGVTILLIGLIVINNTL